MLSKSHALYKCAGLRSCCHLPFHAMSRTVFLNKFLPASQKLSNDLKSLQKKGEFHNELKNEKNSPLSFSALRILKAKQSAKHQRQMKPDVLGDFSKNDSGDHLRNLNSIMTEMDEITASFVEDHATNDEGITVDITGEEEDPSLEFITLPDANQELKKRKYSHILGSEDSAVKPSQIPCSGCGAHLQCNHRTLPGFMPSEYYKLLTEDELKRSICQRCHFMRQRNLFVEVSTTPKEYADMISKIKPTRSIVLMVVDVMDIDGSIVPHLTDYIGVKHPLIVVGNKADLLAPDSSDYLKNVQSHLKEACKRAGLRNLQKCVLVSAKTGYGIERLITDLFSFFKKRVDVYIVGTANAGKSSLFNMLLGSDYCKHTARDLIQRATVSVWPGTTLSLLKFPIMRPSHRTVYLRQKRLSQKKALAKEQARLISERKLNPKEKTPWELKDDIATTDVRTDNQRIHDESGAAWGQEVVSFQGRQDGGFVSIIGKKEVDVVDDEDFSDSYWMYDTPGIINPDQVMNLLTPEENSLLVPTSLLTPRTAVLQPNQTLFVSGLARLDYMEGEEPIQLAIHASNRLPVYIQPLEKADKFYETHIGTEVLGVPLGDKERLQSLPSLVGEEFVIYGGLDGVAGADIQLSSVGWVSVAPRKDREVKVRAFSIGRKGLRMRLPPLLPNFTQYRGKRIHGTPFYRPKDPGSALGNKTLNDLD